MPTATQLPPGGGLQMLMMHLASRQCLMFTTKLSIPIVAAPTTGVCTNVSSTFRALCPQSAQGLAENSLLWEICDILMGQLWICKTVQDLLK